MGGFLFGFDTVVISGAEQTIQSLWSLGATTHGLAMSMALWGTMLGALFGYWPTDRYGRQKTLLAIGVLYFVSAVGSAFAPEVWSFMVARFIGGLGVGISTIAAPLYISEIAPAERRGRLTGLFQLNIVLGILVAFLSNAMLGGIGANAWRWMLGVEAFPALLFTLLCLAIPESPRWLIGRRGDRAGALRVFRRTQPELSDGQLAAKVDEVAAAAASPAAAGGFWSRRLRVPIGLAFFVAFFNQLSGINAVLYFAPRIFEMTGLATRAALLQSVGVGITNLIFTLIGLRLIDRYGRRTLLYIGSVGYIASLGACAWAFYTGAYMIVPACIFLFIAAHAVGQGAVIWVLISEIFPNRHRAAGQTLGCFTHWLFAALITMAFPLLVANIAPGSIFLFFCCMMVLQLLWVKLKVPETKGRPLEQIERDLERA
jgi:sugar porter (SP) family MFS transporter